MALTAERDTPRRENLLREPPVAANTRIFKGALVALVAGFAAPATTATGLVSFGRAEDTVDNLGGGAGAKRVRVRSGVFLVKNSATDPLTGADRGASCFLVDDETVARTDGSGARSRAGRVMEVETTGVWVEVD